MRAPTTVVAFPPGRRGVLLPVGDRRTAALGIAMYTACRPGVVRAQRVAAAVVGLVGARALLSRGRAWSPPCGEPDWRALCSQWRDLLGPFDSVALYQRRQVERSGTTLLLTRAGRASAVVKVRPGPEGLLGLTREQDALHAVRRTAPSTFSAPQALGAGAVGDLAWSAQSSVFTRPHRPVLRPDPRLYAEVADCLRLLAPGATAPAHHDLTPWNLRADHRGRVWLYDWEGWGEAPPDADRAYFAATRHAVATGHPLPEGLDRRGVRLWWTQATSPERTDPNAELTRRIVSALETMLSTSVPRS